MKFDPVPFTFQLVPFKASLTKKHVRVLLENPGLSANFFIMTLHSHQTEGGLQPSCELVEASGVHPWHQGQAHNSDSKLGARFESSSVVGQLSGSGALGTEN